MPCKNVLTSHSRNEFLKIFCYVSKIPISIFQKHPTVVYLDSASTSQRLGVSLKAEEAYYLDFNANVHRGLYPLAEEATEKYEAVRETARKFLNAASAKEIIFTRGATESLNIVAQGWGRKFLKKGDEIVLSVLEHHSNLVPWQMVAKERGVWGLQHHVFVGCKGVFFAVRLTKLC